MIDYFIIGIPVVLAAYLLDHWRISLRLQHIEAALDLLIENSQARPRSPYDKAPDRRAALLQEQQARRAGVGVSDRRYHSGVRAR